MFVSEGTTYSFYTKLLQINKLVFMKTFSILFIYFSGTLKNIMQNKIKINILK